ncbi:hypothetical protein GQ53DRAFT_884401 [Thozetella sp. PMI_491]|nr:hypothetical protein GQ53DRAFT_884401 [Thozetella sp. PMI_491]
MPLQAVLENHWTVGFKSSSPSAPINTPEKKIVAGKKMVVTVPLGVGLCMLSLVQPSYQLTGYVNGTCELVGDSDLYGPGVRVSYYLFLTSAILAVMTHKTGPIIDCAKAVNILTFSILVVLIRNTTQGSFVAIEWFLTYPVILITFFGTLAALPIHEHRGTLLCFGFVLTLLTAVQPWLYWTRMYQGRNEACPTLYWLFGTRDFFGPTWTMFFKVFSILSCVAGVVIFLIFGVIAAWNSARECLQPAQAARDEEMMRLYPNPEFVYPVYPPPPQPPKTSRIVLRVSGIFLLISAGVLTIAMTEKTLRLNNITFQDTPIDSTGQLIPFVGSLLTLGSTIWACLCGKRR